MEPIQSPLIYDRMEVIIVFLNKLSLVEPLFLNGRVYYFNQASVQEGTKFSCQNRNIVGV